MGEPKENGWQIPARVWQLGWVSFFADVCSEVVYPVIPLFLRYTLGAPIAAMGAIEGCAEALVCFMKGWSGRHSDVTGKRTPYIRWGYGLSALGKPLMALAGAWPTVLGARLLDRFGKGIRTTARDALIADSVDKAHYGKAFGLHRALDTAGAFVGVLIALAFLALWPGQYRTLFLFAAIPGAVSVLLVMAVREASHEKDGSEAASQTEHTAKTEPLREALAKLPPAFWRALGLNVVFALANSSDTFLLLRARGIGLSDVMVILCYAAYNVTYTLLSYPAGVISDRIGRWRVMAAGWLLYAGVYWGFSLAGGLKVNTAFGLLAVFGLFGFYGIYIGLTQGVSKALVADHSPANLKGTAMGMYYFATGFATLAASLLTGFLWDRYSAQTAFQVAAILAVISAALVPVTSMVFRRQKAE